MKRLLTIMLSMMLVLSSCLMISAECEDIVAKQDNNGDLVITAYSDEAKKVIQAIYDGCGDRTGNGQITVKVSPFFGGSIMNVHDTLWDGELDDRMYIEKDGDSLRVSKQTLVDGGFVNGNWELQLHTGGNKTMIVNVAMSGLKDATPNIASSLTLEGKIDAPIEGASTEIDQSKLKLLNQDNVEISQDNFWVYWAEEGTLSNGEKTLYGTDDEVFDVNKNYFLVVGYSYIPGENDNTDVKLNYAYANLVKDEYHAGGGGTLGTYFICENYIEYTLKFTVGKIVAKENISNGVSKDIASNVSIKNSANEIQSLFNLTSEEQKALDDGKNLEVQMVVGNQSVVSKEDVTKVDTYASNNGLTTGVIYDISLYKNIEGDANKSKVTETNAKTIISFPLEDRLINTDSNYERTYKVIRVHDNGDAEPIDATYDADSKTITFATDKFSTYAIAYKDTKKEEEKKEESSTPSTPSKSYDAKDTNHDGVVSCEEANGKNWIWSESKKACVYKVTNTSAK